MFKKLNIKTFLLVSLVLGEVYLLCKGAESTILGRVTEGDKDAVLAQVDEYAIVSMCVQC